MTKANEALDKMADNARELGLDYELPITMQAGELDCTHAERLCAELKMAEQPAQQEPVAFEEWLAKQHGDPEEIGFLQALRIAYIAGQDSITSPPPANPADTNCPHCRGMGYDASGYTCTCVGEKK